MDEKKLSQMKYELDGVRLEVQELTQRVDWVCEANRALHARLDSLNTMIEDRQQH